MNRTEDSLRDLCDNIKWTNIWNIGVAEEEEKKKGYEKIFEEIIVENFLNMEKEIVNQVQKAQRVPYRINPRRNMPRHTLIKLTKTKHKESILKQQGKSNKYIQGKYMHNSWSFSSNSVGQKEMSGYILSTERGKCTTRLLYLARISFKTNVELKSFTDKKI